MLSELNDSLARSRAMFETAVDGILTIDERGVIESLNPAAERMFGYAAAELVGRNVSVLMPAEHAAQHDGYIERYLEGGERRVIGLGREVEGRRSDGSLFPLHLSVSEWLLGGQRMFTGICHDLTETKRSQAWAQSILETAADAVVTIDASGSIVAVNPATERLFGYQPGELLGRNVSALMPAELAAEHDGFLARHLRTGERRVIGTGREVAGQRKDGSTFPLCLSVSAWSVGSQRMFTGICHDLTEQRRAADRLAQAAKLASLGELAGKIAHEINNPISIIVGKVRLRLTDPSEELPDKARRDLEKIAAQCDRLGHLTRSLLDYCRPGTSPKELLDACLPLQRAANLAADKASRHGVDLRFELAASVPLISGNRSELEQVFLNLCINALDAVSAHRGGSGGTVTVSARAEASLADGRPAVLLSVQDDGPGIAPEVRERLFEPFVTTKAGAGGTGLGLAVCHGIIQDHGGEIEVESPEGGGTTFLVRLPVAR